MYTKISLFTLFYLTTLSGFSQDNGLAGYSQGNGREYKLYKHEISLGFVKPLKNTAGISFTTEPKFSVIDNLAIGLRLEGSLWINTNSERIQSLDGDAIFSFSTVPTVDYYFSKNLFRPFVGIGYGLYFYPSSNGNYTYKNSTSIGMDNNTGLMIRGGFEVGHFRLGVNYNRVSRELKSSNFYSVFKGKEDWSYIDLKVGLG